MTGVDRREGIQVEREEESNQHKSKGERRDVMMRSKEERKIKKKDALTGIYL